MRAVYKQYRENIFINRFVNLFSVDVLIKASTFILLPVYLKLMTQAEFGLYNYLISIVAFFSQILNFGLYVAQSKIYQELHANEKGGFIYSLQILLIFLMVPTILIVYYFEIDRYIITLLFKNPIDYSSYRLPLLFAVIVSVYSFMLYNYFLTAEKIKQVQRYNIIRLILLNAVVLGVLYFFRENIVSNRLILTFVIEGGLVCVFSYFFIKEMTPRLNRLQMTRSLKLGLPVMASAICSVVINFGDKFFLEKYAGFVDLSIYYLAFSIAGIIPLLFNTIQNIWLPVFFRERDLKKNIEQTSKMVVRLLLLFIAIAIVAVIALKVALYFSIIDPKYDKAMLLLPILFVSTIVSTITHMYINYVTFFEQTYIMPLLALITGLISIGLNIYFIKTYGLYGAAISTLITSFINFLQFYLLFKFNVSKAALS